MVASHCNIKDCKQCKYEEINEIKEQYKTQLDLENAEALKVTAVKPAYDKTIYYDTSNLTISNVSYGTTSNWQPVSDVKVTMTTSKPVVPEVKQEMTPQQKLEQIEEKVISDAESGKRIRSDYYVRSEREAWEAYA